MLVMGAPRKNGRSACAWAERYTNSTNTTQFFAEVSDEGGRSCSGNYARNFKERWQGSPGPASLGSSNFIKSKPSADLASQRAKYILSVRFQMWGLQTPLFCLRLATKAATRVELARAHSLPLQWKLPSQGRKWGLLHMLCLRNLQ